MISFRSHVVSLLAVFLALAVGIALGGGPLSEIGRAAPGPGDAANSASGPSEREATFAGQVLSGSAGRLYAAGLEDRSVAVVVLPGAPSRRWRR